MTETKAILQQWSPARLNLFLTLRDIEVPKGISREDLIELVLEKKDVPILHPKASKTLFRELTHEQLVDYLSARGYVVLNKGKLVTGVPVSYIDFQEAELLKGAIEDFEKTYATDSEEIEYQLQKVLTKKYSLADHSDDIIPGFALSVYRPKNVDNLLAKFGIDCAPIGSLEDKFSIARFSVNFFNAGIEA